jgi:hypothetical protein
MPQLAAGTVFNLRFIGDINCESNLNPWLIMWRLRNGESGKYKKKEKEM